MSAEGAATTAAASFETRLIARIQAGQTEAEGELYQEYSERVYYLGLRETRSPADAEDIREETFLRVLQAIRGNELRIPTTTQQPSTGLLLPRPSGLVLLRP